jgi:protein gp37
MRANNPNAKIKEQYAGLTEGVRWNGQIRLMEKNLDLPLRVRKPQVWAVWNDLFHEDVPFEFIGKVFARMHNTRYHTFIVLTKRPKRMAEFIHWYKTEWLAGFESAWPREYQHLWLGVTCENQELFDQRWQCLRQIPASVVFISYEPGLGPLILPDDFLARGKRAWLIAGGESGPGARPIHPDWPRSLRDQCQAAGTPFFFKQWGEWLSHHQMGDLSGACKQTIIDGLSFYRVGKKNAGRLLDNQEWSQFPEVPRA